MLNRFVYALFFSLTIFMGACAPSEPQELPFAVGKLGSLVVVADNSTKKALNDTIEYVFMSALPHLPNEEPYFEMLQPNPEMFHKFYFNQKSVMVLVKREDVEYMEDLLDAFDIDSINQLCENPQPVLKVLKDKYAKNQHIVYLFGKDNYDLGLKLSKAQDLIRSTLINYELKDEKSRLFKTAQKNDVYMEEMKKELGMSVRVPDMFSLKLHKNGFWWFEYNAMESDDNKSTYDKTVALLMHAYPYKDTADFSYAGIRSARDSVVKYMIPGEIKGSYMGTSESKFYPPRFIEQTEINKQYAVKVRGWWNMWNMSMGGPFIRYVVHEPKGNRLFAFEGFVFKPGLQTKERDLRLIESIALTIE